MGYHLKPILTEGIFGHSSKIREELEELEEALEQNNRILALCELSDLYGAIEGVALKLGFTMEDLESMSDATQRAFRDGSRKPKSHEIDTLYLFKIGDLVKIISCSRFIESGKLHEHGVINRLSKEEPYYSVLCNNSEQYFYFTNELELVK